MGRKFFGIFIFFFLVTSLFGKGFFLKNQVPAKVLGKAKLILKPLGVLKNEKEKNVYTFEILIDLRGVKTLREDTKKSEPTVLGGYTVGIKFDRSMVKFLSVKGGRTREFRKPPFHTNNKRANDLGLVKFSAVHTVQNSPTGLISVAFVKFKALDKKGLKSIKIVGDSLATSMKFLPNKKILGPISIPFLGESIRKSKAKNLMHKHIIIKNGKKKEVK